jgi:hypothetical protein
MVFQIVYLLVEDIPGSSRFLQDPILAIVLVALILIFYLFFFYFVISEKAIFKLCSGSQ